MDAGELVRRAASFRPRLRLGPVLALVTVLAVLTMPVDYRAGSSLIHPHSTVQLLGDLASGHHHHHGPTENDHAGGNGHRQPVASEIALTLTPELAPVPAGALVPLAPAYIAALASLFQPDDDQQVDEDRPVFVSGTMGGKVAAYSLLLPVPALMRRHWRSYQAHWPEKSLGSGRTHRPEPPPPRETIASNESP